MSNRRLHLARRQSLDRMKRIRFSLESSIGSVGPPVSADELEGKLGRSFLASLTSQIVEASRLSKHNGVFSLHS